jgi:cell volume regulation protein A
MDMTLLMMGAGLVFMSILLTPLSTRIGMPVLLLFLGIGMLAGEEGPGGINFHDLDLSFLAGNLCLAIILLDGGMRTKAQSFRVGLRPALVLASFGVVMTTVIGGVFAAWLLDIPLLMGLLIGAIVSSTDAAAVFALLHGRGLQLNERVGATLEIESGSNDPMAIFLTLMLIEIVKGDTGHSWMSSLIMLVQQFGLGALSGLAGGWLTAQLVKRINLVPALYPLLVVAAGITLFSATNAIGGSGFLAIYLLGVVLANQNIRGMNAILQIHDGLAWLAQMVLFLLLGLLVTPSALLAIAPYALLIALVLIFIARPAATLVSLLPFGFSLKEHVFIGWVGLRGAVPIVLALFPLIAGIEGSQMIFQIAFVVVLVSLLLQGSSLAWLARKLELEVPGEQAPFKRMELNHQHAGDHELLLVPLSGKRWQDVTPVKQVHLPERTLMAGIFREGVLMPPRKGVDLQEHDVVAVFAHKDQIADVGVILGRNDPPERLTDRRFFGEFVLNGDARLADVQMVYGVSVDRYPPEFSLSECFAKAHHGHPVVGDRLDLGGIMLIVKAVEGDRVIQVGMKIRKK